MADPSRPSAEPTKLPRLPKGTRVTKRPLLHPPITGIKSSVRGAHKTIYVSARSPFLGTTKRVETYLRAIAKRQQEHMLGRKGHTAAVAEGQAGPGEDVIVKATGKAIDKVLRIALFYMSRDGYRVRLRTGSVGAIDDVVAPPASKTEPPPAAVDGGGDRNSIDEMDGEDEDGDEIPEARVRRTSMLEVAIRSD